MGNKRVYPHPKAIVRNIKEREKGMAHRRLSVNEG